jgi:alkyl hydroperoxide reductase subunit AhpC
MTKIGLPAPHFRVPALVKGNLIHLDSVRLRRRCLALCFLPRLGLLERGILEYHAQTFERENAHFLGVMAEGAFFSSPWQRGVWPGGLTPVSDPLGRLSRSFGVPRRPFTTRCQSFIIDTEGFLRYHLVHDLNGRGMSALLEILKTSKAPDPKRSAISNRHLERGCKEHA